MTLFSTKNLFIAIFQIKSGTLANQRPKSNLKKPNCAPSLFSAKKNLIFFKFSAQPIYTTAPPCFMFIFIFHFLFLSFHLFLFIVTFFWHIYLIFNIVKWFSFSYNVIMKNSSRFILFVTLYFFEALSRKKYKNKNIQIFKNSQKNFFSKKKTSINFNHI